VTGKLIGVGTGPGDPDLLTIKAVRAVASADVVAYFAKPSTIR
jgi:precorrin-2/cobalt-factor-2 C20-methyltransferase